MGQKLLLKTADGEFKNHIAWPDKAGGESKKYPGLILIHAIWGIDAHIRDVVDRYAKEGFVVIAPDLLGSTGILEKMSPKLYEDMQNPEKRHEAQAKMREIMQPISTKEFSEGALAKLGACFEYLSGHGGNGGAGKTVGGVAQCTGNIGVLGFCFGGTYSWQMAVTEPRLKAAVPFYGQPPQPLESVASISCPVLALYGEKDERLMASLPDVEKAMKANGKDFTFKVYKNTGHAFFDDTKAQSFNKEARDDSWNLTLNFLRKNLR